MENGEDAIRRLINNPSWFRDTPHYWAEASLPLAYAVACVEVVSKGSEKTGVLYNEIVEAWSAPRMKVVFDDIDSIIPESGKERIREALIHQENELSPDPKPTTTGRLASLSLYSSMFLRLAISSLNKH